MNSKVQCSKIKIIDHLVPTCYYLNFSFTCKLLRTICVKIYLNQISEVQLQRTAVPRWKLIAFSRSLCKINIVWMILNNQLLSVMLINFVHRDHLHSPLYFCQTYFTCIMLLYIIHNEYVYKSILLKVNTRFTEYTE